MKEITSFRNFSFAVPVEKNLPAYIRSVGHFCLLERNAPSCRCCQFGELFWCIEGKGAFQFENSTFVLKPGYAWYYPPGSCHEFAPADKFFHYRFFTINGPLAGALFQSAGIKPGINYAGVCPDELFKILEHDIGNATQKKCLHLLSAGFEILCRAASAGSPGKKEKDCLQKAMMLMERDFSDPELDVQAIADLLGINRVQLSREFSRHYGVNISSYLKNLRVQKALVMLRETSFSLEEIAVSCGFSSGDYLGKVISGVTGQCTAQFRNAPAAKRTKKS